MPELAMSTYFILFVRMGNICRSPTAHGVFRQMVNDKDLAHLVQIDSDGLCIQCLWIRESAVYGVELTAFFGGPG
jgi:hypothetical protein